MTARPLADRAARRDAAPSCGALASRGNSPDNWAGARTGWGKFRVLLAKAAVETSDDIHAYKPFVDGLRAIAILSVVGGHLELPGMSGGFVGVDVFFVISGYLIINQIASDIRNGRFGLWDFWARRALRILPAFLLVVSAC